MVKSITNKEEIEIIINEKIKNRDLNFTPYYYLRLDFRGMSHKKVLEIFPQFDKIFAIEVETLKHGDIGYELFYRLSGNVSFSIATCQKKGRLIVIHAVEYKRSLQKRFPNIKLK